MKDEKSKSQADELFGIMGTGLDKAMSQQIPQMELFRKSALKISTRMGEDETPKSRKSISSSQRNSFSAEKSNNDSQINTPSNKGTPSNKESKIHRQSIAHKSETPIERIQMGFQRNSLSSHNRESTSPPQRFSISFREAAAAHLQVTPSNSKQSIFAQPSLNAKFSFKQKKWEKDKKDSLVQRLRSIFAKKSAKDHLKKATQIPVLKEVNEEAEDGGNKDGLKAKTLTFKQAKTAEFYPEKDSNGDGLKDEVKNLFLKQGDAKTQKLDAPEERHEAQDIELANSYKKIRRFKAQIEEGYLKISEKNKFEKLRQYNDEFPFIKFRKGIMWVRASVSHMCLLIISNPLFEAVSLCTILINSVFLAFERFDTETPAFVENSDSYFLAIYTIEMFSNIFGLGFFWNRGSYLRDPW